MYRMYNRIRWCKKSGKLARIIWGMQGKKNLSEVFDMSYLFSSVPGVPVLEFYNN
jgi:hypothetical protein